MRRLLNSTTTEGIARKGPAVPDFQPKQRIKKDRKPGRNGQVNMTFWMALSTNAALKELAATKGWSMQDLVASFVDRGLREAGEQPFKFRDE